MASPHTSPRDLIFNFYYVPGTLQGTTYLFVKALGGHGATLVDLHDNEVLPVGVAAHKLQAHLPYLAFTLEAPPGPRMTFSLRAREEVGALHIYYSLGSPQRIFVPEDQGVRAPGVEEALVSLARGLYADTLPVLAYGEYEGQAGTGCGACVRRDGPRSVIDLTLRTLQSFNLVGLYSGDIVEALGPERLAGPMHRKEELPGGGLLIMTRPLGPPG